MKLNNIEVKELSKEIGDKLCEPIAILSINDIEKLEDMLGVELIVGIDENLPDGYYRLTRLSLANSFINDVKRGLRVAIQIEKNGCVTGVGFVNFENQYTKEDIKRAEKMSKRPVLDQILDMLC